MWDTTNDATDVQMRREIRDLRLEVDGLREALGQSAVDHRVVARQLECEHPLFDVAGLGAVAVLAEEIAREVWAYLHPQLASEDG